MNESGNRIQVHGTERDNLASGKHHQARRTFQTQQDAPEHAATIETSAEAGGTLRLNKQMGKGRQNRKKACGRCFKVSVTEGNEKNNQTNRKTCHGNSISANYPRHSTLLARRWSNNYTKKTTHSLSCVLPRNKNRPNRPAQNIHFLIISYVVILILQHACIV